ncbi:dihydropteroate synthase [Pandoraea nosoerga]|uniref:Dihydropteroate synthase n=2 Tax=Burkholderiaceae TaxID=119060 RepID=A0A5E4WW29_9BURK|nr:dihydropteroate synthase [Pandoraea nosoerga]MBN4676449.1 dihydropteroate synthase [Pandoraea nosoerga]MBN4681487.1 dihydropteroate synthase [Pandoraea nosoerga]MBN4747073.1 dihydropteroate synthase [Pandoraea nosoerga]VVE29068.1 Dihydropteroate synthase [Pandoraea nosoerga]
MSTEPLPTTASLSPAAPVADDGAPSGGEPSDAPASPARPDTLRLGPRFALDARRVHVMGILNVTPDSFSDGGRFVARDAALRHAEQLIADGADILDIGGESTRPGAEALPEDAELERVVPIVEALRDCGVPLSVDTYKPGVMRAVLAAGADMINDIWGFQQPGAIDAVRDSEAALCIMHMLHDPKTMQDAPIYTDVVTEVAAFLDGRVDAMLAAGVAPQRLYLDPGFGFGKNLAHNLALLKHLRVLSRDGLPLLVGMSRKRMLGEITGRETPTQRRAASVAAAICAAQQGAAIVRVHDVAETVDALKVWQAVRNAG